MAFRFRIVVAPQEDGVHFHLLGDFDEASASHLIKLLRRNSPGRFFIHTDDLGKVHPFARETFRKNLHSLKGRRIKIQFIGKKAKKFAPMRSLTF